LSTFFVRVDGRSAAISTAWSTVGSQRDKIILCFTRCGRIVTGAEDPRPVFFINVVIVEKALPGINRYTYVPRTIGATTLLDVCPYLPYGIVFTHCNDR
jgi:hypothetical protein